MHSITLLLKINLALRCRCTLPPTALMASHCRGCMYVSTGDSSFPRHFLYTLPSLICLHIYTSITCGYLALPSLHLPPHTLLIAISICTLRGCTPSRTRYNLPFIRFPTYHSLLSMLQSFVTSLNAPLYTPLINCSFLLALSFCTVSFFSFPFTNREKGQRQVT
jgi:hypothetical protein